jgi:hypothetical protein
LPPRRARPFEPPDLLEQAACAVGPARVEAEALEEAGSGVGCAVGFDLLHGLSVRRSLAVGIGPRADLRCG